jgi:hypothetical protein
MPRKKDIAPDRGADAIVEEITDHLRPWKGRQSRQAIAIAVGKNLKILRENIPLSGKLFNRRRLREHALRLDKSLREVEDLLKSAPDSLNLHLFKPVSFSKGEIGAIETKSAAFLRPVELFFAELARLRKVCAQAIHPGFGVHPNFDYAKWQCSFFAYMLMDELSNAKITGTKDASFRVISSLLYEAVSGEPDADLKRHCDQVLRDTPGP